MKKPKSIADYLPKKQTERVLVQGKVPPEIHALAITALKADGITMQDFIVASLKRYLEERKAA